MKKLLLIPLLLLFLTMPVSASEFTAPEVPERGRAWMPETTDSFAEGLQQLLKKGLSSLRPDLSEAGRVSMAVMAAALMVSVLQTFPGSVKQSTELAGAAAIASVMLLSTNSLIALAVETLHQLTDYGKMLLPVMTAALAAQGGVTTSGALYAGTTLFSSLLSGGIARFFVPMVYLYLTLSVSTAALGAEPLKKLKEMLKGFISWSLKTILTVYTTYMGITGILSGSTDAAALKAAKIGISTFVPVVGGILSDASEALLVSVGLARSAAGLYGIFAILALFLEPFCRIGSHYLLLKLTSAITDLFGTKNMSDLVADFSVSMGLLLGMTGSVCLLQLISTVCFLKGVG